MKCIVYEMRESDKGLTPWEVSKHDDLQSAIDKALKLNNDLARRLDIDLKILFRNGIEFAGAFGVSAK